MVVVAVTARQIGVAALSPVEQTKRSSWTLGSVPGWTGSSDGCRASAANQVSTLSQPWSVRTTAGSSNRGAGDAASHRAKASAQACPDGDREDGLVEGDGLGPSVQPPSRRTTATGTFHAARRRLLLPFEPLQPFKSFTNQPQQSSIQIARRR